MSQLKSVRGKTKSLCENVNLWGSSQNWSHYSNQTVILISTWVRLCSWLRTPQHVTYMIGLIFFCRRTLIFRTLCKISPHWDMSSVEGGEEWYSHWWVCSQSVDEILYEHPYSIHQCKHHVTSPRVFLIGTSPSCRYGHRESKLFNPSERY